MLRSRSSTGGRRCRRKLFKRVSSSHRSWRRRRCRRWSLAHCRIRCIILCFRAAGGNPMCLGVLPMLVLLIVVAIEIVVRAGSKADVRVDGLGRRRAIAGARPVVLWILAVLMFFIVVIVDIIARRERGEGNVPTATGWSLSWGSSSCRRSRSRRTKRQEIVRIGSRWLRLLRGDKSPRRRHVHHSIARRSSSCRRWCRGRRIERQ